MTSSRQSPMTLGTVLSKVPEVTIFFWVIKILATTIGETAADYLATNLGLGLSGTTWIMAALLVGLLVLQFRAPRYVPVNYWLVVVVLSIVGTLITDNLTDKYNVALETTTVIFAIVLAVTFTAWFLSERTLSIHSIYTARRRRSTGSRSSSPSRSVPHPATSSPSASPSATGNQHSCSVVASP